VDDGWSVFARSCTGCHGPKGGGTPAPALVGSKANLSRFGDAQRLLSFVSQEMPVNRPGALEEEEYQQLVALLLVENGLVDSELDIDFQALDTIPLQ
jgi:mono/diheme cytochrome c family protein